MDAIRPTDHTTKEPEAIDAPVRRLLERIAGPAAAEPAPDLPAIAEALAELARDIDYVSHWAARLGDRTGLLRIHAPERGPRLTIVHRLAGQISAVHSHGTWVAVGPVSGLETHRRYGQPPADGSIPEIEEVSALGPADVVTLLPPGDVHDHGHVVGRGSPAYVLILTGDDQTRYERHEWDPATGRHRLLPPGETGRWLATEPWPND